MSSLNFTPGSLVTLRNRPWVVLASEDQDLLLIKPLGGSDEEITGIFKPLAASGDLPKSYDFIKPGPNDLHDYRSAILLYQAAQLSFRNAAGPFRCLAKLSFRPRSYQLVPLIMALKQDTVRMLIADDVGVGKTIEALLIARELHERKEIKRFAIVCLPHLCDQWQEELRSKFGVEAVIIRSGTVGALDRQIRTNENIFDAFPFQIISIDYIKSGNKKDIFLNHCPECIIVDEAHTCARPAGANNAQQQRFHLVHQIAQKTDRHLLLLTATPHSGKQQEFQSLLGLLHPDFENMDLTSASESERKRLALHFIQRRRADVVKWLDEDTSFPERDSSEDPFEISPAYAAVFNDILGYARNMVASKAGNKNKQRYSYWDALALLRGVMSSPAAGVSMLLNKALKKQVAEADVDDEPLHIDTSAILDDDFSQVDALPANLEADITRISSQESARLKAFAEKLDALRGINNDHKARKAILLAQDYIKRGFNPIIFCRYIPTANYLGDIFKEALKGKEWKQLHLEVVTSELNDELRREKIDQMNKSERRLLIATDCLSEGINLQDGFNAVIHYDLPWNPNRLEQREGRVDRFGQQSDAVLTSLIYGSNNPIDGVVLDVLLRKAKEIRRAIGISVPFPENSASVMEAVANAILLKPGTQVRQVSTQLSLFEAEEIEQEKQKVQAMYDRSAEREKQSRHIFAQHAIKAHEIEADLREVDQAIGSVQTVESFVVEGLRFLGVQVDPMPKGWRVYTANIPGKFRNLLSTKDQVAITFRSPVPAGYAYLGRNHRFTEHLTQHILNAAINGQSGSAARSAVIRTKDVELLTILIQFRVRNVIAEQPHNRQVVAEEMWLWGYEGALQDKQYLQPEKAMQLLVNARPTQNMSSEEQAWWLEEELQWMNQQQRFKSITDPVAIERAEHLVQQHSKVRKLTGGTQYKVVEPVLPMDVLGVYILLPELK
jgi:superfamily II DNA or RNA helicase